MTRSLDELGRFLEPALLILVGLAEGPKHGYALMESAQSQGVRLGPGTLYAALARLEGEGWIEALESTDRRRPYRLTEQGRTHLGGELARLRRVVRTGLRALEAT
jgi:DNA-binding PadR family transcriptional regulator